MSIGMVMKEAGRSTSRCTPAASRESSGPIRRPTSSGCAARSGSRTRWPRWARGGSGSCSTPRTTSTRSARSPATRRCRWCAPGLKAIYLLGLAGGGGRQHRRADVPRPEPLPGRQRPQRGARGSTRRCAAPTRSSTPRARPSRYWFAPIVADAEAGFGGPLNAFELMKAMIEAGAAGVHFEDQLASREEVRPHGRQGAGARPPVHPHPRRGAPRGRRAGRAHAPRRPHRRRQRQAAHRPTSTSATARSSSPASARRRASSACKGGLECAIARGLAYAPYADLLWCETSTPGPRARRRQFAEGIHAKFPGKLLAYNCSPSFNWKKHLDDATIAKFQRELGAMGYKFQFVTLAGLPRAQLLDVRAGARLPRARHGGVLRAAAGRVRRREATATPPPATSARWAPATSTRSPRSSPAAPRRRWRSERVDRERAVLRGRRPRPPRSPEPGLEAPLADSSSVRARTLQSAISRGRAGRAPVRRAVPGAGGRATTYLYPVRARGARSARPDAHVLRDVEDLSVLEQPRAAHLEVAAEEQRRLGAVQLHLALRVDDVDLQILAARHRHPQRPVAAAVRGQRPVDERAERPRLGVVRIAQPAQRLVRPEQQAPSVLEHDVRSAGRRARPAARGPAAGSRRSGPRGPAPRARAAAAPPPGARPPGAPPRRTGGSGAAGGHEPPLQRPGSAAPPLAQQQVRSGPARLHQRAALGKRPRGEPRARRQTSGPSAACHRAPLRPQLGRGEHARPAERPRRPGLGTHRMARQRQPEQAAVRARAPPPPPGPRAGWNPTASPRVKGKVRPPPSSMPRAPSHWTICTGRRVGEGPVAGPGGLPGPVTASRPR